MENQMQLIQEILSDTNMELAIKNMHGKSDRPGTDGVRISQVKQYWDTNKEKIITSIMEMKYEPGMAYQYEQLNKKGKRRKIVMLNAIDRVIARAIVQVIAPEVDNTFSDRCYGYRQGRGTKDVALFSAEQIEHGREWVAVIDISDFFDCISHELLLTKLEKIICDDYIRVLIEKFVSCRIKTDEGEYRLAKGIIQGSALSPMLSNIFLTEIDNICEEKYPGYCRYGDDIRIYVSTQTQGQEALDCSKSLIEEAGLHCNNKKCGVFMAVNKSCLGYDFIQKNGKILISQIVHKNKSIYHVWQKTALKEIDHNYHIVSDGILTKKDFTILFENNEEKKYLPVEAIDSLSIYSNIVFSAGFFEIAEAEGFSINIINRYGELVGRFIPKSWRKNTDIEIAQIRLLSDEKQRLKIAKKYQNANIFNIRAALRYYERRGDNEFIVQTTNELTELLKKVNEAADINQLMMLEAQARQKYFQCFNVIMAADDFQFTKRTRRPPEDALNAMISFGNTLLYTRFANEIYRSALDIRFGILHSYKKRTENLNLNLADLFKPILVDRTIFTLVNRKMINEIQDFEETENGGIYMTERGKRIFIQEFESKLSSTVSQNGIKVSYAEMLRQEVRKLQDYFKNNKEYRPYKYVN